LSKSIQTKKERASWPWKSIPQLIATILFSLPVIILGAFGCFAILIAVIPGDPCPNGEASCGGDQPIHFLGAGLLTSTAMAGFLVAAWALRISTAMRLIILSIGIVAGLALNYWVLP
jgi:hypothetical protein